MCVKENVCYITNQQRHINDICFTIYYPSPKCFGRFYEHHYGVIQNTKNIQPVVQMYNYRHQIL